MLLLPLVSGPVPVDILDWVRFSLKETAMEAMPEAAQVTVCKIVELELFISWVIVLALAIIIMVS
jgi:hypothetical protein